MPPKPSNTAVIDPPETAVAAPAPQALTLTDPNDTRGMDGIEGSDDATIPRLAVAQKTSPQLDPSKLDKSIDGLKLFQMFNSVSGENYGNGPLEVIVVRSSKRAMEFAPDNSIIRKNVPLDDAGLAFGPNGEKPKVTLFREYLLLDRKTLTPLVFSLKGTQHKAAKDLNGMMLLGPKPIWSNVYSISSMAKTSGQFTTAGFVVRGAGRATPDEVAAAERWYAQTENFSERTDPATHEEAAAPSPDDIPF